MVTGLVTNDVGGLAPGQGCYAAALTAKGKIIADVRVFVDEGSVLTDAPPRAAAGWASMVKKFVNPRVASHTDETTTLRDLGVFGRDSRLVAGAITGIQAPALTALAPYAHVSMELDGVRILVVRSPDLGVDGFELIVPSAMFASLWERAVAAGAVPAGLQAWEIARVEAGRPEWGIDMDDNTIPQEANFDELHAISYTKGCYVGQETVARVHFRGHVNRHIRGIRASGDALEAPPAAATLHDANGLQVGDVRSSVRSPRMGGIALAMVRREVVSGTGLVARWKDAPDDDVTREQHVDVVTLPFTEA
jgi:folate-binding protein YgfZ